MKVKCRTLFDITATGVTGHYKSSRVPFTDKSGKLVTNDLDWNRARNQQRNLETIIQVVSLRTQVFNISTPDKNKQSWTFTFEIETPDAFGPPDDPFSVLLADAQGVPMLRDLDNNPKIEQFLITTGTTQNIWFEVDPINNILEN